jgi:hypothetical protein
VLKVRSHSIASTPVRPDAAMALATAHEIARFKPKGVNYVDFLPMVVPLRFACHCSDHCFPHCTISASGFGYLVFLVTREPLCFTIQLIR